MTKENAIRKLLAETKLDREEIERSIDIICSASRTPDEACHYIKMGTLIYEAEDIRQHLDRYIAEWGLDEEEAEDFRAMVSGGDCVADWDRTTYGGAEYLIQFVY